MANELFHRLSPRRRGYDSRWDRAQQAFLKGHPHCTRCAKLGWGDVKATTVDHIVPHRLGMAQTAEDLAKARHLFWDKNNWQPLCSNHHSSAKQREERSGIVRGCTADGRPIDPSHPWNRRPKGDGG